MVGEQQRTLLLDAMETAAFEGEGRRRRQCNGRGSSGGGGELELLKVRAVVGDARI